MTPDVEALALDWLRNAPDLTGIGFGTQRPADLAARLPYVVVERIGGTIDTPSWRAGGLVDRAGINLQAWAGPNRADARRLIHTVIHSLLSTRGVARPGGVIVRVAMLAGPTAVPDPAAPKAMHRNTAAAQLTVRDHPRRQRMDINAGGVESASVNYVPSVCLVSRCGPSSSPHIPR